MTESAGRTFAWRVFGVVVLLLVGAMVASLLGLRVSGSGGQAVEETGGEVVVVGAAGLTWSDIDEQGTPTLWSLIDQGASAGLIVRGAHELTCPADGWLTLGAGQRAAADDDGAQDCERVPALTKTTDDAGQGEGTHASQSEGTDDTSATVPDWAAWGAAAERRPLDAQLGTLGSALAADGRCLRAIGPLAALGAAETDGTVRRLAPPAGADADAGELTAYEPGQCDVTLIDAGVVTDQAAASTLDTQLDALVDRLPDDATLLVVGLADRDERAGVRAVVAAGNSIDAGLLYSPTTRQQGLVQTTDVTATILALAGAQAPPAVSGLPVTVLPDGGGTDAAADAAADTDAGATAARVGSQQDLAGSINAVKAIAIPVLGVGCVLAVAALVLLLVWPGAGAHRRTGLRMLGLAVMAFPASAFLVGLVPWWRGSPEWLWLAVGLLVLIAAQVALAMAGPWRRHPVGPPAIIAAAAVVALGVDVILGARLGLYSILGVQPITAGRFYGMGNVGYGIFAVSGLLLAGLLAGLLRTRPTSRRMAAALVVGTLGLLLILIDGAGAWGADFGGVPALVVALGVLGLAAVGLRLTPLRVVGIGVGALAVAGLLMFVDWLRPADSRTHLGNFLQSVLDGGAVEIVVRKLDQSLGILVRYPVAWVGVLILVVLAWAVLVPDSAPGRRLAPLWNIPLLHSTVVAILVCMVIGWALNDSGIAIVGIGLAVLIAALIAIGAALPPGRVVRR